MDAAVPGHDAPSTLVGGATSATLVPNGGLETSARNCGSRSIRNIDLLNVHRLKAFVVHLKFDLHQIAQTEPFVGTRTFTWYSPANPGASPAN